MFTVSFDGGEWAGSQPVNVTLETARDQLTFLELDLSRLDRKHEAAGLQTSIWYR